MGKSQITTTTSMNTFVTLLALVGCALASAPEPVMDTAAVAAAKAHFQAAYDAAAAEAAPDHDVNFVSNFHDVIVPHDGKYVTYAGKYSPGVYPYGVYPYAAHAYGAYPYGAYPYGALPYAFGYHPLLVAKPEEAAAEEGDRKK